MIKKSVGVLLAFCLGASSSHALEVEPPMPSEASRQKRVALSLIGVGSAVAMSGAALFFVGRSGASLHVASDGTLQATGDLDEARAAFALQRLSAVITGVGFATVVTGTIAFLLIARSQPVSLVPVLGAHGGGVVLSISVP